MAAADRPAVSVVVPFAGTESSARRLLERLEHLRLMDHDELMVVDNSPRPKIPAPGRTDRLTVIEAGAVRSSYHARNVGANAARSPWLLFLDADCRPSPTLLDEYFAQPISADCGAVGGDVLPADSGGHGTVVRYARARRYLDQGEFMARAHPFLVTANLLVRREAWAAVGGFAEVRSGGDVDFCWRLVAAGWSLEHRPGAAVRHSHRETLWGLLSQRARYGAGARWLERRHPGHRPPARAVRGLARALVTFTGATIRRKREDAVLAALDAASYAAHLAGRTAGNRPAEARRRPVKGGPRDNGRRCVSGRLPVVILTDLFPAISETFVLEEARALKRVGHPVRVETMARPPAGLAATADDLRVTCLAADGTATRMEALMALVGRHPLRCAADLHSRRRWAREEPVLPLRAVAPLARRLSPEDHLHVHFAAGAALCAMRLKRISGHPYSVTAHGYDIFQRPRNLDEKLREATFVTSGSDYTVRHLRATLGAGEGNDIHKIVMGVDGRRFRRRAPYPGDGTVCAVGRLIEKKGFRYLIEAAGLLWPDGPLQRLVMVGDGPLGPELRELADQVGLAGAVQWLGVRPHDEVINVLERSDLLVMPCVVAADGDRDSMPVVVKEALAMEVPVVASDEVGLPEVVRPQWGQLVPPGDPASLAAAIARILELPAEERRRMGGAGRRHVLATCDVAAETARLSALIESGGASSAAPRRAIVSAST